MDTHKVAVDVINKFNDALTGIVTASNTYNLPADELRSRLTDFGVTEEEQVVIYATLKGLYATALHVAMTNTLSEQERGESIFSLAVATSLVLSDTALKRYDNAVQRDILAIITNLLIIIESQVNQGNPDDAPKSNIILP